jgi:hypothetical protein
MSQFRSHYYTASARVSTKILRRLLLAVVLGFIAAMVFA